jgi:FixJ family two-component response regulator
LYRLILTQHCIAVIDDDESVAHATGGLIRSLGFAAGVYTSAEQFLLAGGQNVASCLLLDVNMPNMSGLQLQAHLASAGHRIPIIFFTAYSNERIRDKALRDGAVDFLQKPLSEETLLRGIHSALRHAIQKSGFDDRDASQSKT